MRTVEASVKGLEEAVSRCDRELSSIDRRKDAALYAGLVMQKGRALRDLSALVAEWQEVLDTSIGLLTEAVNLFNRLRDGRGSAKAHYELGLAYLSKWERTSDEAYLDISVRAFDEAKELLSYDDDPELYQMIEDRLSKAWRSY